jgi:hypothetical protein
MTHRFMIHTIWLCFTALATPVYSQSFDGFYYPRGATGWSCNPSDLYADGAVIAVRDGMFYGTESACRMTNPRPSGNASVQYTMVCSNEGMESRREEMWTLTADGMTKTLADGRTFSFARCP